MGAILLGIIGVVVGFGISYWRFASPLQRQITGLERVKSRLESANEGIKLENKQLQSQLLQIDQTYQRRIQELEQSSQSQIEALQAQVSSTREARSRDESPSGQAAESLLQELKAKHQSEILAYQHHIHELQAALSSAIASSSDSPSSEAKLPSPSHFSEGTSGLVTGLAGAVAGAAAGMGLGNLWAHQEESPALESEGQESLAKPETLAQEVTLEDRFSEPLTSLKESQILPDSPTLIETPALESSWGEFFSEAETAPHEWAFDESSPPEKDLEFIPQDLGAVLPVPEDSVIPESFNGLENPPLATDLPSFFAETEPDPFANLFDIETEDSDLAFLELLPREEEPFSPEAAHSASDPFLNLLEIDNPSSDWDFGELLPTDDKTQDSGIDLETNGQHDGLDELFDSLAALSEEK